MEQNTRKDITGKITQQLVVYTVMALAIEGLIWMILVHLGLQAVGQAFLFVSVALWTTILIFAPIEWLRSPEIAGSAADYPILVRIILVIGSAVLWVFAYRVIAANWL